MPGPLVPPTVRPELTGCHDAGRPCGATAGYEVVTDARYLWTFEHQYIGSNGWSVSDLEALLGLIRDGRLKPVIDRVLPIDQAAEAERLLEDREVVGKVLLKP